MHAEFVPFFSSSLSFLSPFFVSSFEILAFVLLFPILLRFFFNFFFLFFFFILEIIGGSFLSWKGCFFAFRM